MRRAARSLQKVPQLLGSHNKASTPFLTLTHALAQAIEDGSDLDAREDMCITSLFGGLALANAKLGKLAHHCQPRQAKYQPTVGALITGAVHGFAGPLGGMFPSGPHGALCAATLPHVMRANIKALKVSICVGGCAFSRDGQHSECVGCGACVGLAQERMPGSVYEQRCACDVLLVPLVLLHGVTFCPVCIFFCLAATLR